MSLKSIVDGFAGRRVVVLGDLAVDSYVETQPSRLSREAPVLILRYQSRRYVPGCAANTVMNLRALGADVVPIGIVGDDEAGHALMELFRVAGVPTSGLVVAGTSVVKVRLMSGDPSRPQQQLVRVDMEPEGGFSEEAMLELIARAGVAEGAEGVVVSDYDYGAASPGLLRAVQGAAQNAVVSVDSRLRIGDFNADLLTPNEWEAAQWLGRPIRNAAEAAETATRLREKTGSKSVLLTRGNAGMVLADGDVHHLPISGSEDIVDVSGAGDTVVAAATLSLASGASYLEAAQLANYAAGVTVMKSGAATVSPDELRSAIANG